MSSSAELHLSYKVSNAQINLFPFPHFYVRDVFPQDFYDTLQEMLPDPGSMLPIRDVRPVNYEDRFVLEFRDAQLAALPANKRAFWTDFHEWLVGGSFGQLMLHKFSHFVEMRFHGQRDLDLYDEALLVQDITNYSSARIPIRRAKSSLSCFICPRTTRRSIWARRSMSPRTATSVAQGARL